MKPNPCFYAILLLILLVSSSGCGAVALMDPTPTNTPESPTSTLTPTSTHTLEPPTPTSTSTLEPPTPSPTSTPIYQTTDGILLGANLNCPNRASFGTISENCPLLGLIVNNPVSFQWFYVPKARPSDWSTYCVPTSFTLYLALGPDYNNVTSYPVSSMTVTNLTNLLQYSFSLPQSLAAHSSYRWMVVGHAGEIDIDQEQVTLLQDNSAWKVIYNSIPMASYFYTGPVCNASTIKPVILLNPPDNAVFETDTPFFQWEIPDCIAKSFVIDFSTHPQMAIPYKSWGGNQSEFLMYSGTLYPCVQYYWQVKAGLYDFTYQYNHGGFSYPSEIRAFIIRSAACPEAIVGARLTPTPYPTLKPVATATLVSVNPTNPPVNCVGLDETSCNDHPSECTWIEGGDSHDHCENAP
jgi:hypothetical protein